MYGCLLENDIRVGPMDFADSPEHAAFRAEFRHWLETNLSPEICVDDAEMVEYGQTLFYIEPA